VKQGPRTRCKLHDRAAPIVNRPGALCTAPGRPIAPNTVLSPASTLHELYLALGALGPLRTPWPTPLGCLQDRDGSTMPTLQTVYCSISVVLACQLNGTASRVCHPKCHDVFRVMTSVAVVLSTTAPHAASWDTIAKDKCLKLSEPSQQQRPSQLCMWERCTSRGRRTARLTSGMAQHRQVYGGESQH
jgi:hypothetical protein